MRRSSSIRNRHSRTSTSTTVSYDTSLRPMVARASNPSRSMYFCYAVAPSGTQCGSSASSSSRAQIPKSCSMDTPLKRSKIEKETNFNVMMNFIILMGMCLATAIASGIYDAMDDASAMFFEEGSDLSSSSVVNAIVTFAWVNSKLFWHERTLMRLQIEVLASSPSKISSLFRCTSPLRLSRLFTHTSSRNTSTCSMHHSTLHASQIHVTYVLSHNINLLLLFLSRILSSRSCFYSALLHLPNLMSDKTKKNWVCLFVFFWGEGGSTHEYMKNDCCSPNPRMLVLNPHHDMQIGIIVVGVSICTWNCFLILLLGVNIY